MARICHRWPIANTGWSTTLVFKLYWLPANCVGGVSQRSLHNEPIFRLLLKVAVKGTQQCEFLNFCGTSCPNNSLLLEVPCSRYLFSMFVLHSIKPFSIFEKLMYVRRRLVVIRSFFRHRFVVGSSSVRHRLVVLSSSLCRRFVVGSASFRRPFVVAPSCSNSQSTAQCQRLGSEVGRKSASRKKQKAGSCTDGPAPEVTAYHSGSLSHH